MEILRRKASRRKKMAVAARNEGAVREEGWMYTWGRRWRKRSARRAPAAKGRRRGPAIGARGRRRREIKEAEETRREAVRAAVAGGSV